MRTKLPYIFLLTLFVYCTTKPPADYNLETKRYPIGLNGKWGLADENGNTTTEPTFQIIKPFKYQLAIAKQKDKYGFINPNGDWVVQPIYEKVSDYYFNCAEVVYGDNEHHIDQNGKRIEYNKCRASKLIPGMPGHKLENLEPFIFKKDSLFAIKYKEIADTTDYIYDSVQRLSTDFFVVERNGKYGFFFRNMPRVYKGNVYIGDTIERYIYDELLIPDPPKYKYDSSLYYGQHKYYKFRNGQYWGVLKSLNHQEIILAKYHSITIEEGEDLFLVEYEEGNFGYVDQNGKEFFKRKD